MPITIAICCSEARRPRLWAGEISAMYAGAITEAIPMATPLSTRQRANSHAEKANPVPTELTRNRIADIFMVGMRPYRSATLPAYQAPTAQPSRATATTMPVRWLLMANLYWIASTAPLITALSKPKRKPPMAAAMARPRTFRPS